MAGNFWENDEIVSPAPGPAAKATAQTSGVVPSGQLPAASAPATIPTPIAAPASAPGAAAPKAFWENDEIVSPAPQAGVAPATEDQKPARSFSGELGHQLGLTARAAVNSAATLPAMASDAVTGVINTGLDAVAGKGNGFRFQKAMPALNNVMDAAGVAKPENATERVVQDVATGAGTAAAGVGLGAMLARSSGPLSQAAGMMLQAGPGMQAVSGATGAGASGITREAGGGEGAQIAAGLAGSILPGVVSAPFRTLEDPARRQIARSAQKSNEAGYVIPPADLSSDPVTQLASAVGGKIKTSQEASFRNQPKSNDLARRALGMTPEQNLDTDTLAGIRKDAARAYEPVAGAGAVVPGPKYASALDDAVSVFTSQQKSFPGMAVPPVVGHIEALKTAQFDSADALNTIRVLRDSADSAYRSGDKLVGAAYKKGAGALEDAIEDHLVSLGAPAANVLKGYRDARQLIAKTYTVQGAMNPATGNINAIKLAADLKKGKPLTDELRTVAEAGQAFPKAMQDLKEAPGRSSILDVVSAVGASAATGNPLALGALAVRPATRNVLLSKVLQRRAVNKSRQSFQGIPEAEALAVGATARAAQDNQSDEKKPLNRFQAGRLAFKNGGMVEKVDGGFVVNPPMDKPASPPADKPMNRLQAGVYAHKTGGAVEKVEGGFVVRPVSPPPQAAETAIPNPQQPQGPTDAQTDKAVEIQPAAPARQAGQVTDSAHDAATSPHNDLPEPTEAQQKAGNYKVGRLRVAGMDISVENPEGSIRRGTDPDGQPWETQMQNAHYGYVRSTQANDGDKLDVFVKPGTPADHKGPVFVVDQVDPRTGKFDEHKSVIGATDEKEAEAIYRSNYAPDWKGMAAVTRLPMSAFKAWAKSGRLKEPLST